MSFYSGKIAKNIQAVLVRQIRANPQFYINQRNRDDLVHAGDQTKQGSSNLRVHIYFDHEAKVRDPDSTWIDFNRNLIQEYVDI